MQLCPLLLVKRVTLRSLDYDGRRKAGSVYACAELFAVAEGQGEQPDGTQLLSGVDRTPPDSRCRRYERGMQGHRQERVVRTHPAQIMIDSRGYMDLLDIDQYKKHFDGFGLRDCVVRSRDVYYFVLFQDWPDNKPKPFDEELETRLVPLFRLKEKKWSHTVLTGFGGLMAGATEHPKSQCVAVDLSGQVYAIGSGVAEVEQGIPGGGENPKRGAVTRIKKINGWLYGCSNGRSLFKRQDRNRWVGIGPMLPMKNLPSGFNDFDAFSESDIYAAGGKGDVWHYDGKGWNRVPFPSNMWIESVCCGEDGYVYIGAQSGSVFRGRRNQWTQIHKGDLSLPFKDMVWFGDRIYATNDYGLWEISDGVVQQSGAPIEITNCSGNLSVGDGVMLLAGHYGAALHDEKGWTRLFSIAELQLQARQLDE